MYFFIIISDDLELEIMINSPPAPSVESLALAHLCESTQTTPSPQPNFDFKQGKLVWHWWKKSRELYKVTPIFQDSNY